MLKGKLCRKRKVKRKVKSKKFTMKSNKRLWFNSKIIPDVLHGEKLTMKSNKSL